MQSEITALCLMFFIDGSAVDFLFPVTAFHFYARSTRNQNIVLENLHFFDIDGPQFG